MRDDIQARALQSINRLQAIVSSISDEVEKMQADIRETYTFWQSTGYLTCSREEIVARLEAKNKIVRSRIEELLQEQSRVDTAITNYNRWYPHTPIRFPQQKQD